MINTVHLMTQLNIQNELFIYILASTILFFAFVD